jgi:hypothetical protein
VIAHIGGAAVEETLLPLLATSGSVFFLAARLAFARGRRKTRTDAPRTGRRNSQ